MKRTLLTLVALSALTTSAFAVPLFIWGTDPVTGPGDPRPNSDAAAAAFDTLAASLHAIAAVTFETQPLGTFGTLQLNPDVSVTNHSGPETEVSNLDTVDLGYNTTPFGSQYLRFWQTGNNFVESVQFHFSQPINSFGAYFTGAQENFPGDFTVEFNDSNGLNSFMLDKPAPDPNDGTAATEFVGFLDPGEAITDVWVVMSRTEVTSGTRDLLGIDDIRYTACVPEPASMFALGLGAVALIKRRRR